MGLMTAPALFLEDTINWHRDRLTAESSALLVRLLRAGHCLEVSAPERAGALQLLDGGLASQVLGRTYLDLWVDLTDIGELVAQDLLPDWEADEAEERAILAAERGAA